MKAYKALATYFEQRKEYTTAVHFHQKGLEASFRLGDSTHAADAYKCIGVDYEAVGDTPLAIQYFDKYSDLVQQDPSNKDAIGMKNSLLFIIHYFIIELFIYLLILKIIMVSIYLYWSCSFIF